MSLQNELQFNSDPLGVGLGGNYKKEKGRNGSCSAAVNNRHDLTHGSLKSTDRRKLLVRKVAPTFAEKLWDGSLQLNSSVNVFAVAFFKRFIHLLLKVQFFF